MGKQTPSDYRDDHLDFFHPIGSLYWSKNPTNPKDLFGGTWEQIKDTFVLSAGDKYSIDDVNKNETHTHTLANGYAKIYISPSTATISQKTATASANYALDRTGTISAKGTSTTNTASTGTALGGNTDEASSMPPYITRYCWERIA